MACVANVRRLSERGELEAEEGGICGD